MRRKAECLLSYRKHATNQLYPLERNLAPRPIDFKSNCAGPYPTRFALVGPVTGAIILKCDTPVHDGVAVTVDEEVLPVRLRALGPDHQRELTIRRFHSRRRHPGRRDKPLCDDGVIAALREAPADLREVVGYEVRAPAVGREAPELERHRVYALRARPVVLRSAQPAAQMF